LNWVAFAGGIIPIGHADDSFAFDNEGRAIWYCLRPYRLGLASHHVR
jgi:hypothetical protein